MAKNVVELNIDNTSYTTRPFGTCSTAASTSAKVVTCSDFVLVTYATILVKFANTNSANSPTLNVNGTGAKSIKWNGSTLIGSKIKAGDVYEFIYDGTYWLCLGGMDLNNSVTQMEATSNASYPLLMTFNPSQYGSITSAARYHSDLTYNPFTQTLGLGVLNCTTSESGDNNNIIDIFGNRQLPTTFRFMIPLQEENIAPATSINLAYSGPGLTGSEALSSNGLTIGPNIVDDTTTNGFLISTDKPLHVEGSSLSFGAIGSNIVPNGTYNLGTEDNKWNLVYANLFKGTADSARLTPYGFCETASSTAAKVVTTSVPFVLEAGARISVKFKYNHTGTSGMTLQVNDDTVAKSVLLNGSAVGSYIILANNIYDFIYDGTNWILQPGVQNTAGSSTSSSKLYLIGALSQSTSGVRTYSNSNVYTQSGSIYSNGFYDHSATTGASVYKAIVPKDYTEGIPGLSLGGTHALNQVLTGTFGIPSPKYGGLVYEIILTVGPTKVLTITPATSNLTYNTTLSITLTTDETSQNFRFVRLLLSVPLTVSNTSSYPLAFNYIVLIRLNNATTYQSINQSFVLAPTTVRTIGNLSIIYDLREQTIIDDTSNGTTSWQ